MSTVLWRWLLHPVRSRPLQPQRNSHTVYYKRSSFLHFITTWRWVVVWVWGSAAWIHGKTASLLLLLVQRILYNLSHCHVGVPGHMKKKKQNLDKLLSFKLEMTSTFHTPHPPMFHWPRPIHVAVLFKRGWHIKFLGGKSFVSGNPIIMGKRKIGLGQIWEAVCYRRGKEASTLQPSFTHSLNTHLWIIYYVCVLC